MLIIAILAVVAVGGEVKVAAGGKSVDVSVIRRVNVAYHPVTKGSPLEFDVEGPCWLRVYTRLWWPRGGADRQRYKMSLWQDDMQRPLEFDAAVSPSSYGPGGRYLGEWRSFFVQVPAGANRYRLALDSAQSDTVGVRFAFQPPRPWQPRALATRALELVDGRDTVTFHELAARQPAQLKVEGPCRVRVRVRLSYSPELLGEQSFAMAVTDGKTVVLRRNLRVGRSPSAVYVNESGLTPSTERVLRFSLGTGAHELSLALSGTLARTGAVAVDVLAGEKYE